MPDDERPGWARLIEAANAAVATARRMRDAAEDVRCKATEGGGRRCTADAMPPHNHRSEANDWPKDEPYEW